MADAIAGRDALEEPCALDATADRTDQDTRGLERFPDAMRRAGGNLKDFLRTGRAPYACIEVPVRAVRAVRVASIGLGDEGRTRAAVGTRRGAGASGGSDGRSGLRSAAPVYGREESRAGTGGGRPTMTADDGGRVTLLERPVPRPASARPHPNSPRRRDAEWSRPPGSEKSLDMRRLF
ncbi:hypothetical protein [Streptomyces sp. A5-4]|uniref:hypothetical protein n=1 Tax=Streptomyces sp. A5-4 TaxID=3384771 RepID=UPI003DA9CA6D